ncbi:phosphatidate cytidylyltransferase [Clostridium sp. WILCCON 0269]|uniref:Phosphatidate cytidylyltransferase n=1 Tax=Candidatus Clostridium eludens TaxID=3381663 RepID=A0ABW8SMB0_9CLOT
MNSRYLGAITLIPFILILFLGGVYLKYGVMVISLMGMYEFYKVIKMKNLNPINIIGYLLCVTYYLSLRTEVNYKFLFFTVMVSVFMLLCVLVVDIEYNFLDVVSTLFGFLYVALFFSTITLVNQGPYGKYLIWIIVISAWCCDTTAYYTGKFMGKKKLCPKVSPKKTVEGAIGGVIGSTVVCTLFGWFAIVKEIPLSLYHYIILGILCGVFCQFGDLAASSIKRYVGVKDYGNLIPGHGGILDRFDSILFSGIVVYYYLMFVACIYPY